MKQSKILLLACLSVIFGSAVFAQDEKPIRVETNLVNVDASVRYGKGVFVENLRKEQFDVFYTLNSNSGLLRLDKIAG